MKRTGNDDYRRLGLIDEVSSFRVMKNKFMTVCQTYPPILIAPLTMSDESMKSLSKLFKRDRIPAIVWKSKENVTLSRSEAFSVSEVLRNRRRVNEDPWSSQGFGNVATRSRKTRPIENRTDTLCSYGFWSGTVLASNKLKVLFEVKLLSAFKTWTKINLSLNFKYKVRTYENFQVYQSTLSINSNFNRGAPVQMSSKWNSLTAGVSSLMRPGSRGSVSELPVSPTLPRRERARLVVWAEKRNAQRARIDPESGVEVVPCELTLSGLRDAYKSLLKLLASDKAEKPLTPGDLGSTGWFRLVEGCLTHSIALATLIGNVLEYIKV